jgi:prepilin-type processing-associated H-X9-DG protein
LNNPQYWLFSPELYAYSGAFGKLSFLCPAASRNNAPPDPNMRGARTRGHGDSGIGGTFTPWRIYLPDDSSPSALKLFTCSYGTNEYVGDPTPEKYLGTGVSAAEAEAFRAYARKRWTRAALRSPSTIPFLFDCAASSATPWENDEPPAYEEDFAIFSRGNPWEPFHNTIRRPCIDRHGRGTVNVAFLDGSVRKVGLKELWTFKWHTQYNTQGPWTKAGGALPGDWPAWMRKFKDY